MKPKSEFCDKCGMEFELPDFDEERPMSKYWPKYQRAILKHAWEHHHEDFPQELKSFSEFMRWLVTPEGKNWNRLQGRWRNKVLNGLVTAYIKREDEDFLSG